MKNHFSKIVMLLLFPAMLMAENNEPGKYTKQKNIRKAYNVNPDATVDVINSYGNIYLTTWDEDKIDIDVTVKISGDNEEWVNRRLSEIDVDFAAIKALVSAKTVISNGKGAGKNKSIEINYTVKIPKKGGVKLSNKYGNILTTDLFAGVNVTCQYGRLTMAKLTGGGSSINMDYSDGSVIEYIKTGNIDADYSKLTLNDFGTINLDADYTDLTALSGDDIKYDCSYGKLNLGKIGTVNGQGDYLSIRASELSGNFKVNTNYSKISISSIASKAGDITIYSKYTNVSMSHDPAYSFDYDVNVRYGSFNYEGDSQTKSDSGSASFIGSSKKGASNKVLIRSEYGNVKISKG